MRASNSLIGNRKENIHGQSMLSDNASFTYTHGFWFVRIESAPMMEIESWMGDAVTSAVTMATSTASHYTMATTAERTYSAYGDEPLTATHDTISATQAWMTTRRYWKYAEVSVQTQPHWLAVQFFQIVYKNVSGQRFRRIGYWHCSIVDNFRVLYKYKVPFHTATSAKFYVFICLGARTDTVVHSSLWLWICKVAYKLEVAWIDS